MSDSFLLTLKGFNLVPTTRGWLGANRTNPAYKLSAFQMGQAEPFYVVYESETIEDDLNPNWHRSSTSASFFGEPDMPVMITVVDKQPDKENIIGSVETSLRDIQRRAVGNTEQVDASKVFKLKDARGRDAGMLIVKEARMGSGDEDEEEPEPEPEPTPSPPGTPPRSTTSLGSTTPKSSSTPINGHATNSNHSTPARDSIGGSSSLLEVAKLNQMIKDMTKRQDKLESETKDLKDENQQLKDRVRYLENSLKQDRRIMEMAQSEIRQLKETQTQLKEEIKTAAKTQPSHAYSNGGAPASPNPGYLDEDLIITASADIDEDERSAKRETSHRHRRDKKDSSQKSTSTLSTLDSDEKSNKSSKSGDGDRRHTHRSHRQASSSTIGSRSSEKPRSERSVRKARSMDGSTPPRSSKPSSSSSSSKPSSSRSSPSDRPRSTRDRSEKGRSARR